MADYLFLMESRLSPDQWQVVVQAQQAAEAHGLTLYLAGGAVRDLICGFPIEELDFVIEGKAMPMVRALTRHGARVLWQDEKLQAAELEFPTGVVASVSTARSETYTGRGAPHTAPTSIIQDLKRRDFSVNAIGISLNSQSRGLLLDPTNGAGDIERKEIRTLHNHGFSDDPVRLFRAARLRARLHFTLEQKTAAQYQAARADRLHQEASGEGLQHELRRIAREKNPVEILRALEKEKLLPAIHPRLQGGKLNLHGIAQAAKATQLLTLSGLHGTSFELFLRLLTGKLGARDQAQLFKRIELKRPEISALNKLENDAKRLAKDLMGKEGSSPTRLYQKLAATPSDLIVLLMVEFTQATLQARLKAYLHKYLPLHHQLPSTDLEALGVSATSPHHQKILEAYFYAALEGKLHGKSDHARFLKRMAEEVVGKKPAKKPQAADETTPAARPKAAKAETAKLPAAKIGRASCRERV